MKKPITYHGDSLRIKLYQKAGVHLEVVAPVPAIIDHYKIEFEQDDLGKVIDLHERIAKEEGRRAGQIRIVYVNDKKLRA